MDYNNQELWDILDGNKTGLKVNQIVKKEGKVIGNFLERTINP